MAEEVQQHHHHSSSSACPSEETPKMQNQAQFSGLPLLKGDLPMLPIMYPLCFPGFYPLQQNQDQINHGRGLYAVPAFPIMGPTAGFVPNTLVPFTYNVPSGPSSSEMGAVGETQGQQQQPQQQQAQQMLPAQQRQVVVRRFQIAFQLDLLLILKLVAVIFLFNQDGSRQRLVVLLFFASLIYLYQTGALAPLVRWLSQGMQRAAAPPQRRPAVRADNAHAAERAGNENAPDADGQPGGENENQPLNENRAVHNEQGVEPGGAQGGHRWWGIVKEIKMIVFGFVTSLLPGFHNID